jgi:hypothetical protein
VLDLDTFDAERVASVWEDLAVAVVEAGRRR